MPNKPGKIMTALMAAIFAALMASNAALAAANDAETALAPAGALNIQVSSECRDGNTLFKVKNAGAAWPKPSTFAIYRISDGTARMISKRRMRLAEGQHASFKVKAKSNTTGRLGIAVLPGWYRREAKLDATVTCQ